MELRILAAWLVCFLVGAALWLDGPAIIDATFGNVEQPHTLQAFILAGLGLIMALLQFVYFLNERAVVASSVSKHVGWVERVILGLFSWRPNARAQSGDDLANEVEHREAIYRDGVWRAMKLFAIACVLVLCVVVVAGGVLIDYAGEVL